MNGNETDQERRKFLATATTIIGGIGAVCAATPFIASWSPSVKTQSMGAPVEVNVGKLEPGQKITIAWRGQPIFVIHRTTQALQKLEQEVNFLRDPLSKISTQPTNTQNIYRSIKQQYLVLVGICTHLGCVPYYKPEQGSIEPDWQGGFFCPCHGSKYDMAGRVYKNVPAPLNLPVPPHYYVKDDVLLIGESAKEGAV